MTEEFILLIIFAPLFTLRLIRWLAIFQQKEYRLKRIITFFKYSDGFRKLFLLPNLNHFSRSGFKRPVLTPRIISLLGLCSISLLILLQLVIDFNNQNILSLLLAFLIVYLLIPLVIIVVNFPISTAVYIYTHWLLKQASIKVKREDPMIIGVTGSYGKTSTKQLLSHVLSKKYSVFTTPASYNTKLSIARSIINNYQGEKFLIIEFAAYTKGEISSLAKYFPPNIAIVTGFTPQHIALFGSMDKLVSAKAELIEALPKEGVVFYNGKDKNLVRICRKESKKSVDFYGKRYSIALTNIKIDNQGKLSFTWKKRNILTQLVGKHYISNILAVFSVSDYLKIDEKTLIHALETFQPTANFIGIYELKSGTRVLDDAGTSNPKGFQEIMDLVKSLKAERKIMLFGGIVDLGSESPDIHKTLANQAKKSFDRILYTGFDGKQDFKNIFKKNLVENGLEILKNIDSLSANDLLLIEGRIPKLISKKISEKRI